MAPTRANRLRHGTDRVTIELQKSETALDAFSTSHFLNLGGTQNVAVQSDVTGAAVEMVVRAEADPQRRLVRDVVVSNHVQSRRLE